MGTAVTGPLVVPAWCDPESRNYRLSRADALVGLLMIDDERFVFATPSGVTFNVPRSESTLEWRRGKGFGMIPRLDLSTPAGSFRLYLSRPSTSAPLYSQTVAAEVGEQLSTAGDALGALFDGGVLPLVGVVGNIMSAQADFREMRRGRAARSPRYMLLALLWAIAGGVGADGAPASLMVDR
jgi:hypothetical protein